MEDILLKPQTIDAIHESCYRSYHILELVKTLIERGCDKDTILEIAEFLETHVYSEFRFVSQFCGFLKILQSLILYPYHNPFQ